MAGRDFVRKPWNVQVASVCGLYFVSIGEGDVYWVCGDLYVCDVCVILHEMSCGARVGNAHGDIFLGNVLAVDVVCLIGNRLGGAAIVCIDSFVVFAGVVASVVGGDRHV